MRAVEAGTGFDAIESNEGNSLALQMFELICRR
jgi:hypothetical protein